MKTVIAQRKDGAFNTGQMAWPVGPTMGPVGGVFVPGSRTVGYDFAAAIASSRMPYAQQPSPSSGGLGNQEGIGTFGAYPVTVPGHSASPGAVAQQEYNAQQQIAAQSAQLREQHSFPMFKRDSRYTAFQDALTPEQYQHYAANDAALQTGTPPVRIPHLIKAAVSSWAGIQQWAYTQTNQRMNMRPAGPWPNQNQGLQSIRGVGDVLVQGSGTRRIPSVFVPSSVY